MASWGEALSEYSASKRSGGFSADVYKSSISTRAIDTSTRRAQTRSNPITDPLTSGASEASDFDLGRASIGWKKTIARDTKYNVITGADKETGELTEKRTTSRKQRPELSREYNIISGVEMSPGATAGHGGGKKARDIKIAAQLNREYDIVSNMYRRDHVSRTLAEKTAEKEREIGKYMASRVFDPITCVYVDEDKESHEREREEDTIAMRQYAKEVKRPPVVRFSEGEAFDITSGSVMNSLKAELIREKEETKRLTHSVTHQFQEFNRERDFEQQDREASAAINRISHKRSEETQGYDILTNEPYDGLNAKLKYPFRTRAKPSVGDIIAQQLDQHSSNNSNNNNNNGNPRRNPSQSQLPQGQKVPPLHLPQQHHNDHHPLPLPESAHSQLSTASTADTASSVRTSGFRRSDF